MNLLSYIQKKVLNSQFGKNIALIVGGTAFAQALGIIFSPIITRIYPPEQYGVLTAYSAVLSLLVISASLDYQKAIPIAEDDNMAINLVVLSVFFLLLIVILVFILLIFFGDYFFHLIDSEVLLSYKYLIPFGVFFAGIYNVVLQWGFRDRSYKIIARTKISQSLASNLTKVIMGLMKFGPVGLILGVIFGQSAGITSLAAPIIKKSEILSVIDLKQLKYVLKRYKKFPLYSAPSNYVYTAGNNLPVVLLASLFGSSVTGLFGLANSITQLPMSLIGVSVSQVFYSEAAKIGKNNPAKIKSLALKLIKKIAVIALIPSVLLLLFGPWLFSFVFGSQWYDAGIYARVLSIMVFSHFIITPVGRILEIFECQREGLLLNIVRLGMILTVFLIAKLMNLNSYQTVGLYSLSNTITYISLLVMVMKIIDNEIKRVNKEKYID